MRIGSAGNGSAAEEGGERNAAPTPSHDARQQRDAVNQLLRTVAELQTVVAHQSAQINALRGMVAEQANTIRAQSDRINLLDRAADEQRNSTLSLQQVVGAQGAEIESLRAAARSDAEILHVLASPVPESGAARQGLAGGNESVKKVLTALKWAIHSICVGGTYVTIDASNVVYEISGTFPNQIAYPYWEALRSALLRPQFAAIYRDATKTNTATTAASA